MPARTDVKKFPFRKRQIVILVVVSFLVIVSLFQIKISHAPIPHTNSDLRTVAKLTETTNVNHLERAPSGRGKGKEKGGPSSPSLDKALNTPAQREAALREVFAAFVLPLKKALDAEELRILGQARRNLGQKPGVWTVQQNERLLKRMDLNQDRAIDENEFVMFFASSLPREAHRFKMRIKEYMDAAKARAQGKRPTFTTAAPSAPSAVPVSFHEGRGKGKEKGVLGVGSGWKESGAAGIGSGWKAFKFDIMGCRAHQFDPYGQGVQIAELLFLDTTGTVLSLASHGCVAKNPGGHSPANEAPQKAIDGNTATKWLDLSGCSGGGTRPLIVECQQEMKEIASFTYVTAGDEPGRDPSRWTLYGSRQASPAPVWIQIHAQGRQQSPISQLSRHVSLQWFTLKEVPPLPAPSAVPTPAPTFGKDLSCFRTGMYYKATGEYSIDANAAACQERCARETACAFFTFVPHAEAALSRSQAAFVSHHYALHQELAATIVISDNKEAVTEATRQSEALNGSSLAQSGVTKQRRREWKLMQITDMHISVRAMQSEFERIHFSRMHLAMHSGHIPRLIGETQKITNGTLSIFRKLLSIAKREGVNALLLSGDLVNFPRDDDINAVYELLEENGIPYIYIAGNHDWSVEASPNLPVVEQMHTGYHDVLYPLVQRWTEMLTQQETEANGTEVPRKYPSNHFVSKLGLGGLNILGVDNSDLQISLEQRCAIQHELANGTMTIIMSHAGFFMPGMAPGKDVITGDPRYGWAGDKEAVVEGRERWPREGNSKDTLAFVEDLQRTYANPAGPVVGVFSGHEHINRVDRINNVPSHPATGSYQYVTQGGFIGGHRLITVRDLRSGAGRCYLSDKGAALQGSHQASTPLDVISGPYSCKDRVRFRV